MFKTGAVSLLEQTQEIQGRKHKVMIDLLGLQGLQEVEPITQVKYGSLLSQTFECRCRN